MKELESHLIGKNRIELSVKKQEEIEYVLEGTIKAKTGHFVWEINTITRKVNKAEYKIKTVPFNINGKVPLAKLIINKDCVYIPALNLSCP